MMHERLDNLEPRLYHLYLAVYLMHKFISNQRINVIHVHGRYGDWICDTLCRSAFLVCGTSGMYGVDCIYVSLPRCIVDDTISSISYIDTQLPIHDTHLCIQATYHTHMRDRSQFKVIHYSRLYESFKKYDSSK